MKWPFYELRDKERDPGGGGGDPPKNPPADPPKGGAPPGDPPKSPPAGVVPADVLPEELRNRPAAEQKFILEHMVSSLASRNKQVDDLKTQVAELRGAIGAQPPKPKEPDPHEGKTLSELMLEDSEAALDRYMESKGYVKAFGELTGRVNTAEYSMVRAEIDDFEAYEEDVNELLKHGNIAATRENVRGAYTMAVGARALAEKAATARGGGGTIPPSGAPPGAPPKDEVQLSALEREIAAAHNMTPEQWVEAKKDGPLAIKLPT